MKFYIVDAFTDKAFGGNPAGVVIYDNLDELSMQKIAAELRFSETAFVKPLEKNKFGIKYFTPNSEIELCGHATVAAFGALLNLKYIKPDQVCIIETKTGTLPVYTNDTLIMMEQKAPKACRFIEDTEILSSILNINPYDIGDLTYNFKPQIMSTGLWDIMLPVKTRDVLTKIKPDFKKLAEYSKMNEVVGIHAFTLDCDNFTANCRNFAPLYDINEEAATGTSNGALTYYLYMNNVISSINTKYNFQQGEAMNRASIVITQIVNSGGIKILVGGSFYTLSSGELYV